MANFNFITVRLGKDSLPDIKSICASEVGILNNSFTINVKCTQIPDNYEAGDYAFIWLGSDNNKGMPTKWKQGFKAVGRVKATTRGKNYNDTSETIIEIIYIFHEAINRLDILRCAPVAYYWCSSLPLIGIDDHANQTIRSLSNNDFSDIRAFFIALESVTQSFKKDIVQVEPGFKEYFNMNLPIPQQYPTIKNLDELNTFLNTSSLPLQQIFYGAPGTGKSHTIKEQTAGESVIRTTFHPDSDYSTFVGAYKPTTKQVPMRDVTGKVIKEGGQDVTEDRIIYEFVDQAFLQAYISAWKKYASATDGELPQRQFLIIEEINRGNCAQIFGDLFQLLDRNDAGFSEYPIKADNDMRKQLSKAFDGVVIANKSTINQWFDNDVASKVLSGEVLLLPNNLYIWATMNTSDQSLFPIDSAFKRRWDWQYVPICKGRDEQGAELKWSIRAENNLYDWWSFIEKINEQIASATNSADKKLGFFFCKAKGNIISAETFVSKVLFYLWIDVFKDYGFDSEVFNDVDGKKLTFDKFYMIDTLGKTVVRKDKVELFLKNLGVIIAGSLEEELIDEDGNTATTTKGPYNYDRSKYSINGQGNYSKGKTAEEVVRAYANLHPNDNAQTIVNTFLALNVNMPNLIETQAMYTARTQGSNDSRKRTNEVTLANGETVYVSSQFTLDRINDLIAKVNTQNWGITIAKN